jgi:tetratricopeptide (TPR) repeat protein
MKRTIISQSWNRTAMTVEERSNDSRNAITCYNQGNTELKSGDIAAAIKDYDRAIDSNPNFVAAYHNRGTAKAKSGDRRGAIEDYDRAIELDPSLIIAYGNRSRAKFEIGDRQGASADYYHAVNINQN